jgi:NAD(P)H dehydrogenase (quinone)
LTRAEILIVQFPTWCFGLPAMLKGFFDRLMMPGVAFDISDPAKVRPLLDNVKRIVGIATYGRPRLMAIGMFDPPRRIVKRYLRWFCTRKPPVSYYPLYHLNISSDAQRKRFIVRIRATMERLLVATYPRTVGATCRAPPEVCCGRKLDLPTSGLGGAPHQVGISYED